MNKKEELLCKLFSELEAKAYDSEYHTYNYKYTNQVIREFVESLPKEIVSGNEANLSDKKKSEVALPNKFLKYCIMCEKETEHRIIEACNVCEKYL